MEKPVNSQRALNREIKATDTLLRSSSKVARKPSVISAELACNEKYKIRITARHSVLALDCEGKLEISGSSRIYPPVYYYYLLVRFSCKKKKDAKDRIRAFLYCFVILQKLKLLCYQTRRELLDSFVNIPNYTIFLAKNA